MAALLQGWGGLARDSLASAPLSRAFLSLSLAALAEASQAGHGGLVPCGDALRCHLSQGLEQGQPLLGA